MIGPNAKTLTSGECVFLCAYKRLFVALDEIIAGVQPLKEGAVMKKIRTLLPIIAVVLAMLLSACGGSSQNASSSPSPTATSTPSPTPTPQAAAHTGQSADQLLQGLKAKGLPIGAVTTYTA